jgi:hypothetical protein
MSLNDFSIPHYYLVSLSIPHYYLVSFSIPHYYLASFSIPHYYLASFSILHYYLVSFSTIYYQSLSFSIIYRHSHHFIELLFPIVFLDAFEKKFLQIGTRILNGYDKNKRNTMRHKHDCTVNIRLKETRKVLQNQPHFDWKVVGENHQNQPHISLGLVQDKFQIFTYPPLRGEK